MAVIYTRDGKTLVHRINWKEGAQRVYERVGNFGRKACWTAWTSGFLQSDSQKEIQKAEKNTEPLIGYFDHGEAVLEEGSRFYTAQEEMQEFLLQMDDDRMLYNFREASGLDVKGAEPMTGWDAPECHLKGIQAVIICQRLRFAIRQAETKRLKKKHVI